MRILGNKQDLEILPLGVSIRDTIRNRIVVNSLTQMDREDPFFLVDLGDIISKHKQWLVKMPRVEPYYAVKCNDTSAVLELLANLGTGFDCASKGEIQKVLDLGVDPSRIIYANPCKTMSYIKYANKTNVELMTFDNEIELHKVKEAFPSAKLVLRFRPEDTKAQCQLGMKFGCEVWHVEKLLQTAKNLDLEVVGISFHVGSGCRDSSAYARAIKTSRSIFDLAENMGFDFHLLDIGGGFPGQKDAKISFDEFCDVVNSALNEYFPSGCGVKIIAEPGRYYVASAFTLCVNIIAKRVVVPKDVDDDFDKCEQAFMYYVNDGVYGSFNSLMYDHAEVTPLPLEENSGKSLFPSSVWGPTCDGLDCIKELCHLPVMDVGDWLVFEDMGAYTVSAGSTFNGFQKPSLFFVANEHNWLSLQCLGRKTDHCDGKGTPVLRPCMKTGLDVSLFQYELCECPGYN